MKFFYYFITIFIFSLNILYSDTIFFKKGKAKGVKIVKVTYKEIIYKRGQSDIKIPLYKIIDLEYSNTPKTYKRALSLYKNKEYKKALDFFKNILEEEDINKIKWLKYYTYYYIARCYHNIFEYDSAIEYYNYTNNIDKNGRFYINCIIYKADCYTKENKFKNALKELKFIEDIVNNSKNISLKIEFLVTKANALSYKKDSLCFNFYEEALKLSSNNIIHNISLINNIIFSMGEAYIKFDKYKESRKYFNRLKNKIDKHFIPQINNIIAYSYLQEGIKKKIDNYIKEARRIAIKNLIFNNSSDDNIKSFNFFILYKVYKNLSKEKNNIKKANVYSYIIRKNYPNSIWANKLNK